MAKIPITLAGAELLRVELQKLKSVERPAVITAIAEARAHGDLSENAEYDAARERQGFIEGRILELEGKLSNAQIIDPALLDDDGRVVFGSTVDLMDTEAKEESTYQIVGEDEADIKLGKISYSSPIAKALIGKYAGDVAEVRTPGGVKQLEIVDVKYL
ncbi:transcription elongation factor GreA [Usitatibacter palustris]|uniref:Transcription elongation factor GreA n=1 Tax=Usitatibacter palustris TaxID=2732487 RepID=A0A6M4HA23_9PROT|nr:transcription elongation factor GreA [Usitatibacter palustris]QJR16102.1 Transcription elongation factor GreA [Usitatibacter palustris]